MTGSLFERYFLLVAGRLEAGECGTLATPLGELGEVVPLLEPRECLCRSGDADCPTRVG
jgi:hypothetical protein